MKYIKHIKIYMVLLTALLGIATTFAYDFSAKNSDGVTIYYNFIYSSTGTALSVTSSNTYKGRIVIPDSVRVGNTFYKVISIDKNAFWLQFVTSVTIPESITTIGSGAFSRTSIKEIVIPNSVSFIGPLLFYQCDSLQSVTLPNSLYDIPEKMFKECKNLRNVKIPATVECIKSSAFYGCEKLKNIEIPNSVKFIEECAFNYCI